MLICVQQHTPYIWTTFLCTICSGTLLMPSLMCKHLRVEFCSSKSSVWGLEGRQQLRWRTHQGPARTELTRAVGRAAAADIFVGMGTASAAIEHPAAEQPGKWRRWAADTQ